MKNPIKIFLSLFMVLSIVDCKDLNQQKLPVDSGSRKLQVELRMPEPWKKIVIGPSHSIEDPKIPQRFSMFMTGEPIGALETRGAGFIHR